MRKWFVLVLLAAGLARAEVFPLRYGGPLTGELARVEQGRLVIRTRHGVSSLAPRELPRAWTDEHWQRIGLRKPPVRGASMEDTWRGVARAESWEEAVSYLKADSTGAAVGGGLLLAAGLWFCFRGGCFARWRGWRLILAVVLGFTLLILLAKFGGRVHWLSPAWNEEEKTKLAFWLFGHAILFLLLVPEGSGRRRPRSLLAMFGRMARERTVSSLPARMALFGTLLVAQGLWVIAAPRLGVTEDQALASWAAVFVAAAVVAVIGCVAQAGRALAQDSQ